LVIDSRYKGRLPVLIESYKKDLEYILPSAPEIDFPYTRIPNNATTCGPIMLPPPFLSVTDSDLEQWLKIGPTVMMDLGSDYITSDVQAESIARSFSILLQKLSKSQMLWNISIKQGKNAKAKEILKVFIDAGRVRIIGRSTPESYSILKSGYVHCSVHSGRPTAFYEAVA
jgi:hypothetical protein